MAIFHLATALLWLFVVIRFLWPLPWSLELTAATAFILLLGSQHHFLTRKLRGSMFSPEMPRAYVILANGLFGTLLLLGAFQAALDLLCLALSWTSGWTLAPSTAVRYALGISAVGLAIHGVRQAIRVPPLKEVEVVLSDLPFEFDGYRMVHLTDLHLSRLFPARWSREVVARVNTVHADLIVMTGDLVDGTPQAREDDVEPLGDLRAADGIYAVTGNHEYYFGYDAWMHRYQELGFQRLCNRHTVLQRGSAKLVLAGVTDSASQRFGLPGPDLQQALSGAPCSAPTILLAHQPRIASQAAQAGVSLQLSGHTHGGMLRGLDRVVARFNRGFVSGLYNVGAMQLYVNNGTALWNGFALRVGVPSELTVITLRRPT